MDSLATDTRERATLARAVREDRDIREAVLADDRLFHSMLDSEEAFINVSGHLFFSVLLLRAVRDLREQGYTIEREGDITMPVFDSADVCAFLQPEQIRDYLVAVLAGFVKSEQRTVVMRPPDGRPRAMRVNDLDLRGLIRFCRAIDEEHRFDLYCHIADLCLFASGVFSADRIWGYSATTWMEHGSLFYSLAAGHRLAGYHELGATLSALSENFSLAVKPLRLIAERYLGAMHDEVFGR
ncbi:MAG: hypothetical protein OXJ62_13470 [Spirochaetaceae bacterium]|nr:hypothetical protein [Spirochaetaceae bacterium]